MSQGFFPTAPLEPRVAVSVELLELYGKLFERSGDAITAFTAALKDFYMSRGFQLNNVDVSLAI